MARCLWKGGLAERYHLLDTTLRDGEQAPGVVFSLETRLEICAGLDKLGIAEVELGIPGLSSQECEELSILLAGKYSFAPLVWSRAKSMDLAAVARCGARRVHIAFPVSDVQLAILGTSWERALPSLRDLLQDATAQFDFVSVGAQDASRCSVHRLLEYSDLLLQCDVQRLRIADTLGLQTPAAVALLIRTLRERQPEMPLEYHAHNDLGMATANALTALQAGAQAASATILGLGERAGNASLEQLALGIQYGIGGEHGLDLTALPALCSLVAHACDRPIAPGQPVVGASALQHESGIHVAGMLRNPSSFQLFPARILGIEEPDFVLGKHSGRHAVRHFFRQRDVILSDAQTENLTAAIKAEARRLCRALQPAEVWDLLAVQGQL